MPPGHCVGHAGAHPRDHAHSARPGGARAKDPPRASAPESRGSECASTSATPGTARRHHGRNGSRSSCPETTGATGCSRSTLPTTATPRLLPLRGRPPSCGTTRWWRSSSSHHPSTPRGRDRAARSPPRARAERRPAARARGVAAHAAGRAGGTTLAGARADRARAGAAGHLTHQRVRNARECRRTPTSRPRASRGLRTRLPPARPIRQAR